MSRKSSFIYFIASLSLALSFTYFYFLYTNEYPPGSFEKIATYEADKVFQTRLLITELANLLKPAIPIVELCFGWIVPYPISYEVLLQFINVLFVAGLLMILPKLLKVLGCSINPFWSLLIIIPIAWNYIFINGYIDGAGLYYPYDLPSLTLFTLGTILFTKKRWLSFYTVFIVACLNRESACFISIAGFLLVIDTRGTKPKVFFHQHKEVLFHIVIQTILWFSSRIMLSYTFRDNPGEFFETPHSMLGFLTTVANGKNHWAMNNPIWFLSLFAGVWIIPLIFFKSLNILEKRFLLVGVIYVIVIFFRSNMMEVRVYNELNVILFAVALSVISRNYINSFFTTLNTDC